MFDVGASEAEVMVSDIQRGSEVAGGGEGVAGEGVAGGGERLAGGGEGLAGGGERLAGGGSSPSAASSQQGVRAADHWASRKPISGQPV